VRGREVAELRGRVQGREIALPPRALLVGSRSLPSVAGGPADPETWDSHFGRSAAEGEGEARARARKAAALPPRLGRLYAEVREMRERGAVDRVRLAAIAAELPAFPDDWLLAEEIRELAADAA
jgi:phenylalanine-4-hydroxylase